MVQKSNYEAFRFGMCELLSAVGTGTVTRHECRREVAASCDLRALTFRNLFESAVEMGLISAVSNDQFRLTLLGDAARRGQLWVNSGPKGHPRKSA